MSCKVLEQIKRHPSLSQEFPVERPFSEKYQIIESSIPVNWGEQDIRTNLDIFSKITLNPNFILRLKRDEGINRFNLGKTSFGRDNLFRQLYELLGGE